MHTPRLGRYLHTSIMSFGGGFGAYHRNQIVFSSATMATSHATVLCFSILLCYVNITFTVCLLARRCCFLHVHAKHNFHAYLMEGFSV